MPAFLIIAAGIALIVGVVIAWPLISRRGSAVVGAEADQQIFRDQLAEVDRDLAKGTISEAEAEGARIEVSRRLLAAAARAETADGLGTAPASASRLAAAVAVLLVPAIAAAIYANIGAPGIPDQPLAARQTQGDPNQPTQAEAEAVATEARAGQPPPQLDPEFSEMLARLEQVVAQRPDDIEGQRLLARTLANAGRWVDARKAYDRLMDLKGNTATVEEHAGHAEAMVFAAGGYVSPRASTALLEALRLDPAHQMGRYYAGFALRQAGRADAAINMWQTLLEEDQAATQPRGAAWQSALTNLIAETRTAALSPGPTQEDVEAAAELTAEERAEQINAMVAGLEERLTSIGGVAEEWVRLIRAYMALQRTEDAVRIYTLSQEALSPENGSGFVREQALLMGVPIE